MEENLPVHFRAVCLVFIFADAAVDYFVVISKVL
jgi:hypothetical protein